jgi:AcrR family transcriptional regulator
MLLTPTKLDPRVKRTRTAIQEAFEALMRERGYAAVTVHDITSRAEINRATFYAHYQDKSELFQHVVELHFTAMLEVHAAHHGQFRTHDLQALLRAVCIFMSQVYPDDREQSCEMELHVEQQVHQHLKRWFVQAFAEMTPCPNSRIVSRAIAATLVASGVYETAIQWARMPSPPPLDTYISEVMVFLSAGLRSTGYVT